MKMLLAIVHNEDAPLLINELNEKKYFVTKLATTGGFLKKGNGFGFLAVRDYSGGSFLHNGSDPEIKEHSGKRQQIMYSPPAPSNCNVYPNAVSSVPVNVEVGGATIFIMPVDDFRKV